MLKIESLKDNLKFLCRKYDICTVTSSDSFVSGEINYKLISHKKHCSTIMIGSYFIKFFDDIVSYSRTINLYNKFTKIVPTPEILYYGVLDHLENNYFIIYKKVAGTVTLDKLDKKFLISFIEDCTKIIAEMHLSMKQRISDIGEFIKPHTTFSFDLAYTDIIKKNYGKILYEISANKNKKELYLDVEGTKIRISNIKTLKKSLFSNLFDLVKHRLDYYKKSVKLPPSVFNKIEKLLYLNKEKFNKDYCYFIHGDLHLGNILYNPDSRRIYIVDFDKASYFDNYYDLATLFATLPSNEYLELFKEKYASLMCTKFSDARYLINLLFFYLERFNDIATTPDEMVKFKNEFNKLIIKLQDEYHI